MLRAQWILVIRGGYVWANGSDEESWRTFRGSTPLLCTKFGREGKVPKQTHASAPEIISLIHISAHDSAVSTREYAKGKAYGRD